MSYHDDDKLDEPMGIETLRKVASVLPLHHADGVWPVATLVTAYYEALHHLAREERALEHIPSKRQRLQVTARVEEARVHVAAAWHALGARALCGVPHGVTVAARHAATNYLVRYCEALGLPT